MSRLAGILAAVLVILLSMVFAALNAGNSVTLNLGLFTLYRAPVALVAFGGLFVGMLVMFATGVHTDLKVRRILRERLAEESREEQKWIDRDQQDLFEDRPNLGALEAEDDSDSDEMAGRVLGSGSPAAEEVDPEPSEAETPEVEPETPSPLRED